MLEDKNRDFLISIVLAIVGFYIVFEGIGIYRNGADAPYNITQFSLSPAFLPIILGIILIFLSVLLLIKTLLADGGLYIGLKNQKNKMMQWTAALSTNQDVKSMFVGIVFMGLYIFVLLSFFPFWLSSIIFMIGLLLFLRAAKVWKIILISLLCVFGVILFFQGIFSAPLP